jgi:hypothetical protein
VGPVWAAGEKGRVEGHGSQLQCGASCSLKKPSSRSLFQGTLSHLADSSHTNHHALLLPFLASLASCLSPRAELAPPLNETDSDLNIQQTFRAAPTEPPGTATRGVGAAESRCTTKAHRLINA